MGVGGRGNIDPGNRCRDLDQIWHGGSPYPQEDYRLCSGHGRWAWVGVAILTLSTTGGIWTKLGMEIPHTPGRVIGYVVGVADLRGMGMGGRGNINPLNHWRDLNQIWHGDFPHPREG